LLLTYGAAGFAALALEIAWTRALVWIIGQDSYAFAAMLSVVLAGIGLGSFLFSFFIDRIKRELPLLYGFQFFLGVFVFLSIAAVHNGHDLIRGILAAVNSSRVLRWLFVNLGAYTIIQLTVASSVLLIPALIMGAAFPLFARVYIRSTGNVGRGVGTIYSVNTLGGIVGSLAMGFVIVPLLGLLPSIALMGGIYLIVSLLLVGAAGHQPVTARIGQGFAVLAVGSVLLLTANFDFTNILGKTLKSVGEYTFEKVLYYREHATGTVMVKESEIYGTEMLIDGTQVASTGDFDLHSHLYPAHLMSLLKENPKDILVVAFGTGGTSGSLLLYDEVERLDVVEICEGVVEPAKRYFTEMNSKVFANPKLNLIIQDGKNYVRMTDRSYDIIYSGPIHPQSNQGSAALYTREYFEDCRDRLNVGGFQCLWLPLHVTNPVYFKIILKTFLEVYPYVTLWQLPHTENSASHPHLIGSMEPIYPDYGVVKRKLARPAIRADLERLHDTSFSQPYEFLAQLAMDQEQLTQWIEGVDRLNTDNLPVVEFYKHTVNLVASSKASKAMLLNDIAKNMQHPLQYARNVPEPERENLKGELDRLYEGYRYLLVGHSLIAVSDFSGEDVKKYVRQYYQDAYDLLPESSYLQRLLFE
jgi:spermidine synthase